MTLKRATGARATRAELTSTCVFCFSRNISACLLLSIPHPPPSPSRFWVLFIAIQPSERIGLNLGADSLSNSWISRDWPRKRPLALALPISSNSIKGI